VKILIAQGKGSSKHEAELKSAEEALKIKKWV
jgi:dsRNA-specific ribonuclease